MAEAAPGATDLCSQPDLCSFLHAVVQLALLTLKSYTENWITSQDTKKEPYPIQIIHPLISVVVSSLLGFMDPDGVTDNRSAFLGYFLQNLRISSQGLGKTYIKSHI